MALNTQTLHGAWNEVKGKIRERWGDLTEDDLQSARGNVEQLVGMIQRKTGEARSSIMHYLDEAASDGANAAGATAEAMTDYMSSAAETVRDTAHDAVESMREGYAQTEDFVRRRPMESLAVCFGAGLIAGAIVTLTLRSK
ncbi:MAG: CsbD family protein [Planctomycetia bacterium]|nr:CsbD family protein [Planctomycetia bacterium]